MSDSSKENDVSNINIQNLQVNENDSEEDITALKKKNQDMQTLMVKLIDMLKEKTGMCLNLEKQNSALNIQVTSLKDVVAISKNLLGIRNLEVEDMQRDLTSLQDKINEERIRQNEMIKTVTSANKLNEDIKSEYQSQVSLFQQLREKYNEKVALLSEENKKLENQIQALNMELDNHKNKAAE